MTVLDEASARYERAHVELTAAAEQLRRLIMAAAGNPSTDPAETILQIVAKHFSVTKDDLISPRRPSGFVIPRQIAMVIVRRLTSRTLEDVGALFGGRDHGTVMWAEKTVMARCEVEPRYKREFEAVLARCEVEIGKAAAA